ncbi:MAG: TusE/DsrC/DsvC family sulfur relay protein [Proteobacteria bacterium]|nr:TusE/DsrC/DsvC family sulfur relay protein [Pseudomonadota bacterium]MDA1023111.1 TusE/DsrC/DsvC family sulfur relay protein [Pseudomonadota bacterium]
MAYADIDKDANGFLVNQEDWNEEMAAEIAAAEGIADLTQRHWDVIKFLREEYFDNAGNQPNERHMAKGLSNVWGGKVASKDLYALFPMQPSKQATKISGLPETRRKGGY